MNRHRHTHSLTYRLTRAFVATGTGALVWLALGIVVQVGRKSETAMVALALACLSIVGVVWAILLTGIAVAAWREVWGE